MLRRRTLLLAGCASVGIALSAAAVDTGPGGTIAEAPDLIVGRISAHAARLPTGRVVVFGGHGDGGAVLDTAEILDPADAGLGWTPVTMRTGHDLPYFARLADGRFLVAGGALAGGVPGIADAEIFDPVAGTFTTTDSCVSVRCGGTAATLTDGRVLLVGAWDDAGGASSIGEVFDPADTSGATNGTFSITGALNTPRAYPTVVATPGGGALVLGGVNPEPGNAFAITSIETWDGQSRVFQHARDNLFATESGWEPAPASDTYRPVEEQRVFDGRYLFTASRPGAGGAEQTLFTVDPSNRAVERFATTPDLPTTAVATIVTALVDPTGETARILLRDATGSAPYERFRFATVTLRTGALDLPTGSFVPAGDHAPVSGGQSMSSGGRIVLAGGPDLSNPDGTHASSRTLVVTDPPPPLTAPEAPQDVTAAVSGPADIQVRWTDVSDREEGWHVERRAAGGSVWQALGDAPADATSFTNAGTTRQQPFDYRVASFNAAGASAWVETTAPATIQAGKAAAPKSLAFGTVKVRVPKTKRITITNADKAYPLMVGLTGVTGPFAAVLAVPIVIPAKKRATVSVAVTAQAKGAQTGLLTLWTSDAAKPAVTVKLSAKAK